MLKKIELTEYEHTGKIECEQCGEIIFPTAYATMKKSKIITISCVSCDHEIIKVFNNNSWVMVF